MKSPLWILNSALAIFLLGVLLFILLARPQKPIRTSLTPTGTESKIVSETPRVDPTLIYKNDLFGTYIEAQQPTPTEEKKRVLPVPQPPPPKKAAPVQQEIPQFLAPLAVTLKGIIYSNDDRDNRAIIADQKTKKETLHKIGDKILDAELIYIGNNKIMLIRSNGQQETLFVTHQDAETDPIYSQQAPWSEIIQRISESQFSVLHDPFVQRVQNLAHLIDLLDMTTAFQKGRIIGCRIGLIAQGSLGTALGLKQGDIIIAINDIPTTTTKQRVAIYRQLKELNIGSTIPVTLMRSGKTIKIEYILQDETKKQTGIALSNNSKPTKTLPAPTEQRTIDHRSPTMSTIQQIQQRNKQDMINHGGRAAMIQPTQS